jgi:hypothetical protein
VRRQRLRDDGHYYNLGKMRNLSQLTHRAIEQRQAPGSRLCHSSRLSDRELQDYEQLRLCTGYLVKPSSITPTTIPEPLPWRLATKNSQATHLSEQWGPFLSATLVGDGDTSHTNRPGESLPNHCCLSVRSEALDCAVVGAAPLMHCGPYTLFLTATSQAIQLIGTIECPAATFQRVKRANAIS